MLIEGLPELRSAYLGAMQQGSGRAADQVVDRARHDGVEPQHSITRLKIYAEVVTELMPAEQARAINQYVDWMVVRQTQLAAPAAALDGTQP